VSKPVAIVLSVLALGVMSLIILGRLGGPPNDPEAARSAASSAGCEGEMAVTLRGSGRTDMTPEQACDVVKQLQRDGANSPR
jgi:hypothetical protein